MLLLSFTGIVGNFTGIPILLVVMGFLYVWIIIDIIMIATGKFKDKSGAYIKRKKILSVKAEEAKAETVSAETASYKIQHDAKYYSEQGRIYFKSANHNTTINETGKAVKDYLRAVENYDKAIQLDPNYVEAYTGRGLAQYNMGSDAASILDFTKAISLAPNDAELYCMRGLAFLEGVKDFERAIADFDQAIQIQPDHEQANLMRGKAVDLRGHK
jgi:tetratricopeptide (TPR) repeat protein